MPTNQNSNAPEDAAPQPQEEATAANVLSDERLDEPEGGGGLGGASAASPLSGTASGKAGAATPNSPIDVTVPHDGGEQKAEVEAQTRSLHDDVPEPGPS